MLYIIYFAHPNFFHNFFSKIVMIFSKMVKKTTKNIFGEILFDVSSKKLQMFENNAYNAFPSAVGHKTGSDVIKSGLC